MKITFYIDYRTNWGESLWIYGCNKYLGNSDPRNALKLTPVYGNQWSITVDMPDNTPDFTYRYFVKHQDGSTREEWGETPHIFRHSLHYDTYFVKCFDAWQEIPTDRPFYSSAIVDAVNRRFPRDRQQRATNGYITITVQAPMIATDCVVAISGDPVELGAWNTEKAIVMNDTDFPTWTVNIPAANLPTSFEYKFFIRKKDNPEPIEWERRDNRTLHLPHDAKESLTVFSGFRLVNPFFDWKAAGVAIPVFSIRSDDDFGIGDFYDLKKIVDWAVKTGQKFIQILPINDTTMSYTWQDSYPYNANSTFALHPMYLRVEALGVIADKKRKAYYNRIKRNLNRLSEIDYERVNKVKAEYCAEIYAQDGEKTLNSPNFKEFVNANEHWLKSYAAFCVLRDKFHTADYTMWGEFAEYNDSKINRFVNDNISEVNYVYYIQYHLDRQMREVSAYARENGIAIKGDIPIGISRTSVDAWTAPHLFNMDTNAGAPPDDFSVLGQNWGFPTYNWEDMAKDGFAWWKARFRKMAEYFDAYRIDHVLGFFRIWQIPVDALHGLLGIFHPALPFSPEELLRDYGFAIDVKKQTQPLIMDWFLDELFGSDVAEVKSIFFGNNQDGYYTLKENFNTQKKIAAHFATLSKNDKNTKICNGLLRLIDDVLFIEDPYQRGKYHPRISAHNTYSYRVLSDNDKLCFDKIYNDFYYHRHNDFWYGKAMWKLPLLIESTHMLTCAEDLGMIPQCVPAVMNALEILALEIQRMPKDPSFEFGVTRHYPYLSVCTTSTHDMSGIRGWWEENREKTDRFYHNVLHGHGDTPFFAEPEICEKIIKQNLESPSMLCILPLQDWLSMSGLLRRDNPAEEQINIPANSRHYWRYRMHLTVEQLLEEEGFNNLIKSLILHSHR